MKIEKKESKVLDRAIVILRIVILLSLGALVVLVLSPKNKKAETITYIEVPSQNIIANSTQLIAEIELKPAPIDLITLDEQNSVLLDSVFEENSVQKIMRDLKAISDKADRSKVLYLVLDTPGGSVDAGLRMITFIKGLPQKVKTVTIFAASMGFQTVQQLDERLILNNGTLMSHPVSFGVQGQTPYQVLNRFKWIMSISDGMDAVAATRMGLSLEAYKNLVRDEYWAYDSNAVIQKAADKKVLAKCGYYKEKSRWMTVSTLFGEFQVEKASCPLIPGIISLKAPTDATLEVKEYVRLMLTDKASFIENYIVNNKYMNFQP